MDELTITLNYLDKQYESLTKQMREIEKELDAIRTVRATASKAKASKAKAAETDTNPVIVSLPARHQAAEPDTNPVIVSLPACHKAEETNTDPVIISSPVCHISEDQPDPAVIDLTGMTIDLTGAINLLDRLRRIGRAADGRLVNLTEMSRFIRESGASRATLKNLRSGVERAVREHPEHFERVAPGNYRYHDVSSGDRRHANEYPTPSCQVELNPQHRIVQPGPLIIEA